MVLFDFAGSIGLATTIRETPSGMLDEVGGADRQRAKPPSRPATAIAVSGRSRLSNGHVVRCQGGAARRARGLDGSRCRRDASADRRWIFRRSKIILVIELFGAKRRFVI